MELSRGGANEAVSSEEACHCSFQYSADNLHGEIKCFRGTSLHQDSESLCGLNIAQWLSQRWKVDSIVLKDKYKTDQLHWLEEAWAWNKVTSLLLIIFDENNLSYPLTTQMLIF